MAIAGPIEDKEYNDAATATGYTWSPNATIPIGTLVLLFITSNTAFTLNTIADNSTQAGTANAWKNFNTSIVTGAQGKLLYCVLTRSILSTDVITANLLGTASRRSGRMLTFTGIDPLAPISIYSDPTVFSGLTVSPTHAEEFSNDNDVALMFSFWKGAGVLSGVTDSTGNGWSRGPASVGQAGAVTTRVEVNYSKKTLAATTTETDTHTFTSVSNAGGVIVGLRPAPVPTVVQSTSVLGSTTTTKTETFAAATAGNVLLVIASINENAGSTTISTPSGYTLLDSFRVGATTTFISVFGKIAAGGETSVVVNFGASRDVQTAFMEITGYTLTVDGAGSTAGNAATTTSMDTGAASPSGTVAKFWLGVIAEKNSFAITEGVNGETKNRELSVNNPALANSTQRLIMKVYYDLARQGAGARDQALAAGLAGFSALGLFLEPPASGISDSGTSTLGISQTAVETISDAATQAVVISQTAASEQIRDAGTCVITISQTATQQINDAGSQTIIVSQTAVEGPAETATQPIVVTQTAAETLSDSGTCLIGISQTATQTLLEPAATQAFTISQTASAAVTDAATQTIVVSQTAAETLRDSGTCLISTLPAGALRLPVFGYHVSTPHTSALNPGTTATIDLRFYGAMDNWVPSGNSFLVSKWGSEYTLYIDNAGRVNAAWTNVSSVGQFCTSSVATGLAPRAAKWIRALLNPGAGTCDFFMSDDGVTWTALGTQVTGKSTTALQVPGTPSSLRVGESETGTAQWLGRVFRAQVLIGGALVSDVDFAHQAFGLVNTTFVASTGESWTLANSEITGAVPTSGTEMLSEPASVTFSITSSAAETIRDAGSSRADVTPGTDRVFGVLGMPAGNLGAKQAIRAAGATHCMIAAPWSTLQPGGAGAALDATALTALNLEVTQARSAGLKVIFELAIHYAPAWVLSAVEGFTDQAAHTFNASGAPSGQQVANWMWTALGRTYVADFANKVAAGLGANLAFIDEIKTGGGYFGELHYPPAFGAGNSFYGYGSSMQTGTGLAADQVVCPLPGYVLFSGTDPQDAAWLDWYLNGLATWAQAFVAIQRAAGFTVDFHMALPGYGVRSNNTRADAAYRQSAALGEDPARMIAALARDDAIWPYSTWLNTFDGFPGGTADSDKAAWKKVYEEALRWNRTAKLWGENTGGENTAGLNEIFGGGTNGSALSSATYPGAPAITYGYRGLFWSNYANLIAGGGNASLADLSAGISTVPRGVTEAIVDSATQIIVVSQTATYTPLEAGLVTFSLTQTASEQLQDAGTSTFTIFESDVETESDAGTSLIGIVSTGSEMLSDAGTCVIGISQSATEQIQDAGTSLVIIIPFSAGLEAGTSDITIISTASEMISDAGTSSFAILASGSEMLSDAGTVTITLLGSATELVTSADQGTSVIGLVSTASEMISDSGTCLITIAPSGVGFATDTGTCTIIVSQTASEQIRDAGTCTFAILSSASEQIIQPATATIIISQTASETISDAATVTLVVSQTAIETIRETAFDSFTITPSSSSFVTDSGTCVIGISQTYQTGGSGVQFFTIISTASERIIDSGTSVFTISEVAEWAAGSSATAGRPLTADAGRRMRARNDAIRLRAMQSESHWRRDRTMR